MFGQQAQSDNMRNFVRNIVNKANTVNNPGNQRLYTTRDFATRGNADHNAPHVANYIYESDFNSIIGISIVGP